MNIKIPSVYEILVVDDTSANLMLLSSILTTAGYIARPITSGELAIRSIKAKKPTLILLDVRMPGMDGYQVCQVLKADEETKNIPVIFISALDEEQDKVKGFQVGGVDFISKPFQKDEVLARVKTHISIFQLQNDLMVQNLKFENEIQKRKQTEIALEKRMVALTQPIENSGVINFDELFNLTEIQKLQDQFASAFGVASIITRPDGTPITQPSNFSRLCQNIIRCTEKGLKNCMHSDAVIGRHNPEGPIIQPCLSGGLWDAGASITVGGWHVANWLIGQVRDRFQDEGRMADYARDIGANESDFMKAFKEIPSMSQEQFHKISEVLFTMAGQLSDMAYQNAQQARFINERKEAEAALLESEERFRTTLYSIGDGVITTDNKGRIRLMNQLAEQLTGWKQPESVGKPLEEIFHIINEQSREKVEIPVRKVLREGVVVGLANHTLLIAKDGNEIPIADSGAPIRNEKGEIIGVVLVFRDQTDERRAQQALIETEKRFRLLYENAPLSYQSLDPQARLIDVNPVWLRTMGYSVKDEVIGRHFGEFMTTESAELIKNRFADFVAAGEIHNYEFDMVRKDGTIIMVSYEGKIGYDELGHFKQTHCIFTDITEQKKAEAALKESEERFRNIVESSPIGKYFYHLKEDKNLIFTGANPSADRIIGIDHHRLIGKTIQQAFPKLAPTEVPEMYVRIAEGELPTQSFEIEYSEDQIYGFFQVTVFRIGNNSIAVDFMDISDRKKTEIALRENEEKFRSLFENATVGISMTRIDGIMTINARMHEMLGYTEAEFRNKKWQEITHPEDIKKSEDVINSMIRRQARQLRFEKRYLHKNGNIVWTDVSTTLHYDKSDQPDFFITSISDITERKQFEIKLQRSERELKKAQQITHIGSWYLNLADNEVYWSEELYKMYGFDPTLPVPPYTEHMKLFTPESWELLSISLANTAESGIPYELELKTVRDDGSNGWMWVRGETVQDATGKTVGLWGAAQDISERKNAEQLLQKSEYQYRSLFDQASDGIFIADSQGNYVDVNLYGCVMLGYSREEILKLNIKDVVKREDEESNPIKYKEMREEHVATAERQLVCKNGNLLPVEISGKMLDDGRFQGIVRDISERKQAERAILEANRKMNSFFEQSLDGFFFMMLDEPIEWNESFDKEQLVEYTFSHLRISRVNNAMLAQYGAEPSQILGKCFREFFAHDLEQGKKVLQEIFDEGKLQIETEERKLNGDTMFVEGDYTCVYDSEGKITGLFGIQRDTTESKRNQETIRNERTLLRTLINNLPVTVYVKDKAARKIVANTLDLSTIGIMNETAVIGKTDLELFDNEIGRRGYEDDLNVMRTAKPVLNREEYFFNDNGEKRWLLTSKLPIFDENGKTTGLVGIGRDITEQRRANETIQKLTKSIEQSPSTIVITDISGQIEYINPKFTEITGYTLEEVKGQNPRILKSGEMPAEKYKELWDTISSGEVWRGEFHNRKKNGELYWEWATMTSIKNENGEITNYIAIKEDISLRKQMEVDLIVAKEKAEESDRLKSSFLANMSHEIRTPLNSIIGFSELLIDADYPEDQKSEFIHHIINNGNNLLNIISDIVDISKIESGEINIRKSKIKVIQFLDQIRALYLINLDEKKLQFNLTYDESGDESDFFVLADKERLQQIFNNLISNALKFTSEGYIEIGCRSMGDMVEFHVKDTGIGIPADYHQKIFDRFRQVEASNTRKYGGNGLGLAISKNLIGLMGGEIWVESELGNGATFYFTLPRS